MVEPDARSAAARLRKVALAVEPHERIPAQARQPEQRQRHVAQQRLAREQRDDLVGAREPQMRAPAARDAGDVALEQQRPRRESARSSPVIRLNSVVLPAPFGPMISRRSPGSTARSTARGDAQAAERLVQIAQLERGHRLLPRRRTGGGCGRTQRDRPAPQAHRARHQPLGHEHHDDHEDRAEDEVPALDIGAGDVLHDDDQRRAGDRARAGSRYRRRSPSAAPRPRR